MKVGTDGTLLGSWAPVPCCGSRPRILDAGTGTGLIALMMAQRFANADITAIDIDAEAVAQAQENVMASPFAAAISVKLMRLQDVDGQSFDAIVCNPPYFIDSLTSPDSQRTMARHATTLSYDELVAAAVRLLTDEGELSVVIPTDTLTRLDSAATIAGLYARRACAIKTTPRKPAKRTLVAYGKQRPDNGVETDELIIGSDKCNRILKDFYLKL